MKKYNNAELQIVRLNNKDIVTLSIVEETTNSANAADRFRDWEQE
jgi:hypothetical protein